MSALLERSTVSVLSSQDLNPISKVDVTELNTVHDFGFKKDEPEQGGGILQVYVGEVPYMFEVNGRSPIYDETGENIIGMEWYIAGSTELGVPNENRLQPEETTIKGRKDPVLHKFAATHWDEVFLLEMNVPKIIEFPNVNEYSREAAD